MSKTEYGFSAVPQRRAFEEIILQIEQAIIEGRIAVGDRLPSERELAQIFQVSRPSVREALRLLEGFGLVRPRRGAGEDSGLIVTATDSGFANVLRLHASLQRIPLDDLLEARLAVEMWTAAAAASRAQPADIEQLAAVIERMSRTEQPKLFLEHDTEFHLTIARISGNSVAPLLMAALREAIARQMLETFQQLPDWDAERRWLIADHQHIMEEIRSGNPEAARSAIESHIRGFYDRALRPSSAPL